jgi:hypothetical protein
MISTNDMTMMYAKSAALRRELERIARVTARPDDDPKHVLRTAAGWEGFKSPAHAPHHRRRHAVAADAQGSRRRLGRGGGARRDAGGALSDRSVLAAIDAALADRDSGPQRLGELTDALATALRAHLCHEEAEGLQPTSGSLCQSARASPGGRHYLDQPGALPPPPGGAGVAWHPDTKSRTSEITVSSSSTWPNEPLRSRNCNRASGAKSRIWRCSAG